MDKVELRARLDFWQSALSKLRAAYLALVDGGVKSYVIDDRELTRFDLPDLKDEIEDAEKKVDELTAELNGRKPRKAFGIVPAIGDLFREATKMTILPTPAKWLLHFLQQGYSPERALPQAVRRSLLLSPPDGLFFIPKTGGDKH